MRRTHARVITRPRLFRAFVLTTAVFAFSSVLVLSGCTSSPSTPTPSDAQDQADASSQTAEGSASIPIAATVEGVPIFEPEITSEVQSLRSSYGLVDDGDWATFLVATGETAESLRATVIESFAESVLVLKDIEDRGIEVTDAEVDARLEEMRAYYDALAPDGWKQTRAGMGYSSDDAYKPSLRRSMLLEKLQDEVVADVTVDDAAAQAFFDANADAYAGKRSSYIALANEEDASAVKYLIDEGFMTFPEAAAVYSLAYINAYSGAYESEEGAEYWIATDAESAQAAIDETHALYEDESVWEMAATSAGDRGWFSSAELEDQTDPYMVALGGLAAGEVSEPVDMTSGYLLVMCTGSYDPQTDGRDLASVDESIAEQVRSDALAQAQQAAWDAYVDGLYEQADVQITPMPEGLPYDVDLSLADTSALTLPADGAEAVEAEMAADATAAGMGTSTDAAGLEASAADASAAQSQTDAVASVGLDDAQTEFDEIAPSLEG